MFLCIAAPEQTLIAYTCYGFLWYCCTLRVKGSSFIISHDFQPSHAQEKEEKQGRNSWKSYLRVRIVPSHLTTIFLKTVRPVPTNLFYVDTYLACILRKLRWKGKSSSPRQFVSTFSPFRFDRPFMIWLSTRPSVVEIFFSLSLSSSFSFFLFSTFFSHFFHFHLPQSGFIESPRTTRYSSSPFSSLPVAPSSYSDVVVSFTGYK